MSLCSLTELRSSPKEGFTSASAVGTTTVGGFSVTSTFFFDSISPPFLEEGEESEISKSESLMSDALLIMSVVAWSVAMFFAVLVCKKFHGSCHF